MWRHLLSFVWLVSCYGINGARGAEAQNEITIEVAGEAYQGAPIFQVRFDGVVVGTGILQKSIDTAGDGRLLEANNPQKYVETFQFEIPQKVFRPSGAVEISFTNDAWGGEGKNQYDRNLFVSSISVNGKKIGAAGLKLQRKTSVPGSVVERFDASAASHGFVALAENELEALAVPDSEGWPSPAIGIKGAHSPTPDDEKMAPPVQSSSEAQPAPAVDELPKSRAASDDRDLTCSGSVHVADFEKNSFELSPTQRSALDKLVSAVVDKACTFEIVGYASRGGTRSTNKRISLARAIAVVDYLKQRNIAAASATVVGWGQTAQFGLAPTDNQRVVITISDK